MPKPRYTRKQYLVAKGFQYRYAGIVLGLMMIVSLIAAYTTYYTSLSLLGEKLANVYPQGRLVALLQNVNVQVLVRMIFLTPVIFIFAVWFSHRIAGPIYRMKQFLGQVAEGDFKSRVILRKNDEMKDLADAINRMVFKLDRTIQRLGEMTDTVQKDINELQTTCRLDDAQCRRAQQLFVQVQERLEAIKSIWSRRTEQG